jgi:hypothetical protein
MGYIYVLKLRNRKFYVGSSEYPEDRYLQHKEEYGSAWTTEYPPVSIFQTFVAGSRLDEDYITKQYMLMFGIDNVRGGSYVEMELPLFQKKALKKEFETANKRCYLCGKKNHYIRDCPFNQTYVTTDYQFIQNVQKNPPVTKQICFRCGRSGHYSPDCYARKDIDGNYLP